MERLILFRTGKRGPDLRLLLRLPGENVGCCRFVGCGPDLTLRYCIHLFQDRCLIFLPPAICGRPKLPRRVFPGARIVGISDRFDTASKSKHRRRKRGRRVFRPAVACRDRRRNLHSQLISLPSRSNLHRADTHIIEELTLPGLISFTGR